MQVDMEGDARMMKCMRKVGCSAMTCLLEKRKANLQTIQAKLPGAKDLQRTKFLEWLEKCVAGKVEEKRKILLREKVESEQNMPGLDALKAMGDTGPIII
eukprot:11253028-Ditylum_brightwellii.AAC.1